MSGRLFIRRMKKAFGRSLFGELEKYVIHLQ